MDRKVAASPELTLARRIEDYFSNFEITPGLKKLFVAFTAGSFLGFGVRSALRHTRNPQAADFGHAKLITGVNFASKALAVTTVITVSGYALFIVGISALLNVNTPRQFGDKMKLIFGNKYRLEKNQSVSSFREVLRTVEDSSPTEASSSPSPKDCA